MDSHQALQRREVIGGAVLGIGAALLPGCATTPLAQRSTASTGCLPPVDVAAHRVIRSLVGLRPYRAGGFVVRADQIGGTRLVHNYGHGGAGITLSWGSSKLATELGLRGHKGPVAVIGAGVMGLTTARLVQEAGFPVTIYAAALPPETTSNIAGGQWHASGHYRESAVSPEWQRQFVAAKDYSWRRFQIMAGEDYGVRWLPTYHQTRADAAPEPEFLPNHQPVSRRLQRGEHPFPVEHVSRYHTLYVETGRFLRQLLRDVQSAGGKIEVRQFSSPAELTLLPEKLVFNCTGLGSHQLFGDKELRPARGQLAVLLPQPEIAYAYAGDMGYMFPRPDGIVLGGTFELDNWSTDVDPATTARLLAAHKAFFTNFRCAT
jgi:hypothetical protein